MFKLSQKRKMMWMGLAILLILPFVYVTRYAVLSADDFSYAVTIRNIVGKHGQGSNYLLGGAKTAYELIRRAYMSFSGRWFDHFALAFLYKDGINITKLHCYLLIANILFFLSIYLFIKYFCWLAFDVEYSSVLFFIAVLIASNISSPAQIFYWVCGSVGYTLPFSLALLSAVFWIAYVKNNRMYMLILSSVFAFAAAGGSLVVSGFINILLLILSLFGSKGRRKWDLIKCFVPFLFGFIGALINVLAPGTFQRHEAYSASGKLFFTKAMINALKVTCQRIQVIGCRSYFLIGVIVILLIVIMNPDIGRKLRFSFHPIITVLSGVCIGWVSIFPYIMGYNTSGSYGIAGRVLYIEDWILTLCMLYSALHIIIWYRNKLGEDDILVFKKTYPIYVVLLIGFFAVFTEIMGFYEINSVMVLRELRRGTLQEVYKYEERLFDNMQNSGEQDIVVAAPPSSNILKGLRLYESTNWVNEAVAEWFGKNSLTVQGQ